jgi:hypothetical protein
MSALLPISIVGTDAKALNDIEIAVRAGAARALRARAAVQRQLAADGTSAAGEKYAGVIIRTGEAAVAARLTTMFEQIADDIEAGVLV